MGDVEDCAAQLHRVFSLSLGAGASTEKHPVLCHYQKYSIQLNETTARIKKLHLTEGPYPNSFWSQVIISTQ